MVTVEFDPPVTEQVDVAGAVPLAGDIVQRPAGDVVAVTEKSHLPFCIHTVLSVTSPFPTPDSSAPLIVTVSCAVSVNEPSLTV